MISKMSYFYYVPIGMTKRIIDHLQDKFFNNYKITYTGYMNMLNLADDDTQKQIIKNGMLTGIFLLCDEDNIICVAETSNCKINRIFTYPEHRGKGYASILLHKIVTLGLEYDLLFFSPVDKGVEPLFVKANWIPVTGLKNHDGTIDYTHKLFHKKLIKIYPSISIPLTSTLITKVHSMMLPFHY